MNNRILVFTAVLIISLSALPQGATADWVEPISGSKTDDEFMHVTYGFEKWWDTKFQPYPSKSSNRDPTLEVYKGKLWILWEGLLVPNSNKDPVSYKGKLYLRSYEDWNGTPVWGDIIDVTPNAYYADHDNMKGKLITYKDRLYIFWLSYDKNQKPQGTPENRFDIMMRTYDGNELLQLTPPEIISRNGIFGDWGWDNNPQTIIYKEKLYVIWYRQDLTTETGDILYRAFDPVNAWSDINVLSTYPNNRTTNCFPAPAVWKDQTTGQERLYVTWQRTNKRDKVQDTVISYTEDGHTWSAVTQLSRTMDISGVTFDTAPTLASYHNPKTNKNELHAIWRTYKTENTQNGIYDYDIVTRVFDGVSWSPTRELSPVEDTWDDTQPIAIEEGGRFHIFWASKDDYTKNGKDYDIVQVIFDGESYTRPEEVSRIGDTDEAFVDDAEFWNRGDDMNPFPKIYPNKWGEPRLFLTWWTFDYITGCCYDQPEGTHPTIVLKLLDDADHDMDNHADAKDACDDDPTDFIDTDGDKVCDSSDWKPNDPNIWQKPTSPSGESADNDPLPMYIIVLVLLVAAIALMAYRSDKKRPRPKEDEEVDGEDENEADAKEEE